jgi:hypothetical protein
MRPIANAVPAALAEILRAAPLSDGKVAFAWRAAVGPGLERVTAVKRDGQLLIVETTSAQWAREIMRSSPLILQRLAVFLGAGVVTRLETRTNPNLAVRA